LDPVIFTASALSWTASSVGQALIGQLLEPPPKGAHLTSKTIQLNNWVVWRQADKNVYRPGLRKILKQVAKNIISTSSAAYAALSVEDIQLVVDTVGEALMAIDSLSMDQVQLASLDSNRLAHSINALSPPLTPYAQPVMNVLHDQIMLECCDHLIDYFTSRPEFIARTLVEQSRKIGNMEQRLPDEARKASDYETRYKEGVAALNNTIRVFGLGLPPSLQAYKLSTAYVSLSVKDNSSIGEHSRVDLAQFKTSVSFDDILLANNRVVLEGAAGAGKTTLLTRLALHICQGNLPPQLASWQRSVPFLLRLRSFYSNGSLSLPSPAQFVVATTPPVSSEPPDWTASLLDTGRAVVLIDGVDEIPEVDRPQVMNWIEQLVNYYPQARYLLTSRPAALDATQRGLLQNLKFISARLEPMTPTQVDSFIDRWHAAAQDAAASTTDGQTERAIALKEALLRRRALARLATNPLMCAMLCALNRNHNDSLPPGRIALYRAALAMLLGYRDEERRVPAGEVQLTEDQAPALLAQLALWMTLNGRRTISESDALLAIRDVLPRLRLRTPDQASLEPEKVLRYLLERTGVLQEPAVKMLEFLHSSFQDYFAATELIRGHSLDHLLKHAHDPLYHDVIIMAVGQSQDDPERQEKVLGGLVNRAREASSRVRELPQLAATATNSTRLSRSLWLLAAACIADVELVSPDLADQIQVQTKELLPPADISEAEILAKAGEFVIDLLAEVVVSDKLSSEQICGTVRVASLMEGPAALSLIKRFRWSADQSVQAEIVDGWFRSRDPGRYAEEILSDASIAEVDVRVPDSSYIRLLPALKRLRRLHIACSMVGTDLSVLSPLRDLVSLDISEIKVSDITPLSGFKSLETLILKGARIWDLAPLGEITTLKALNLMGTSVSELSWIPGLQKLTALDISESAVSDISPLRPLGQLESLNLAGSLVSDLGPIKALNNLRSLDIERTGVQSLGFVSSLKNIVSLKAAETLITDLKGLTGLSDLQMLDVRRTKVSDLSPLAKSRNLLILLARETRVRNIRPLAQLSRLQTIELMFTLVDDLSALSDLVNLRHLSVRGTGVTDLRPLIALTNLRNLDVRGAPVEDISALKDLPHLAKLNLMGTKVSNVDVLAQLPELKLLDIVATPVRDISKLRGLDNLRIDAILPSDEDA